MRSAPACAAAYRSLRGRRPRRRESIGASTVGLAAASLAGSGGLVDLDAGRLHELGVGLDLVAHQRLELRRVERHGIGAEAEKLLAGGGILQRLGDLGMKLGADVG